MHPEAYAWVQAHATTRPVAVLDIGGRNINGTVRPLFPTAQFTVLDVMAGDGVDVVADAATWEPDRGYRVVTCCEVFEHTPDWRGIVETAFEALDPGGLFIATMAGPGRAPHSAHDGGTVRDGEYYGNVEAAELKEALSAAGFVGITIDEHFGACDVRALATRPDGDDD